ncbi:MAG: DUF6165 family protein [Methylocystis sp.]
MTDSDAPSPTTSSPATPRIPVSWGELIDKITILEIKREELSGVARENVERELSLLLEAAGAAAQVGALAPLRDLLKAINRELWDTVEKIREKEAAQAFDQELIALARAIYQRNDARFAVKQRINALLASEIIEERSPRGG